ncbi:phosphate ABC transporter substrate-binding protein [Franzmannia qiaohouensis]|uniref:Phosphate ABC transporter substrate-binding protein n=1 Tax=Franzmannia qiaohouensis TaxID=1329370 RepID=A0ABU1HI56_9GAMM|nr:phosphate ABC transporter substrate-binding protein [Halomonas qiaohouensis]MDR5907171.1 phosphate ABC transporter substrate-binding protein [Halomonas qiaohouensis]
MTSRLTRLGFSLLILLSANVSLADVVLVVSAKSPVHILTRNELADIYLGRNSRFPNGQPAVPVDQRESSADYVAFYRHYLGQTPAQIKMHWSRLIFTGRGQPPRSLPSSRAVADFVAEHAQAIGYLDDAYLDERLRRVSIE